MDREVFGTTRSRAGGNSSRTLVQGPSKRRVLAGILAGLLASGASGVGRAAESDAPSNYAADMRAAQQALDAGRADEAKRLLKKYEPTGNASDLRGFDWRYLWRRGQSKLAGTGTGERDAMEGLLPRNNDLRIFILPDNQTLAATTVGPALKLFDLATLAPIQEIMAAREALHLTPDGKTLMTAGDGGLQMWDIRARALGPMWIFPRSGGWTVSAFCPNDWIAAVHVGGGQIQILDIGTSKPDKELAVLSGHMGPVRALAFSPDGKTVASAGVDKNVKLWDWAKRDCTATLSRHTASVTSLAFSPEGKVLASAGLDKAILLWNVISKEVVRQLDGHQQAVWAIVFSPDGRTIASASADNTVRLWDSTSGQETAVLKVSEAGTISPENAVVKVVFSPDGNTLAARTSGGTLRVWRAASKDEIAAGPSAK